MRPGIFFYPFNQEKQQGTMEPVILTRKGYFNLLKPTSFEYDVDDIARTLSKICRFGGRLHRFYSVASHSVYVSLCVSPQHAMAALMHDAAEAFTGDLSSPLKALLPEYKRIEDAIQEAIFAQLGLEYPLHPSIKHADLCVLASERRDLLTKRYDFGVKWDYESDPTIKPLDFPIRPLGHKQSYLIFMARYAQLLKKNGES